MSFPVHLLVPYKTFLTEKSKEKEHFLLNIWNVLMMFKLFFISVMIAFYPAQETQFIDAERQWMKCKEITENLGEVRQVFHQIL